jgi:uncharacterized protein
MNVIEKTAEHVKQKFAQESSGHDWWHMFRVWQLAKHIAKEEKDVDLEVVELGALLHDIADFKLHGGDTDIGPREARRWLESLKVPEETTVRVEYIVRNVSFKGAHVKQDLKTMESRIVHDADKLDAIGAIGIARAFAFGGAHGRVIYNPDISPILHKTFDEYKNATPPTLNHFYEKLLLLHERMYTKTGKALAKGRHEFMEKFLVK